MYMIVSFGNKATADVFHGRINSRVKKLPTQILDSAIRKLDMVHAAISIDDLRSPPGNRLETLQGEYEGYHSIRINKQWRIMFRWIENSGAHDVTIIDYH